MKYTVLRRHDGDKPYHPGDSRELSSTDAAHLVKLGVLAEAKAEPASKNKAEPKAANKAAVGKKAE